MKIHEFVECLFVVIKTHDLARVAPHLNRFTWFGCSSVDLGGPQGWPKSKKVMFGDRTNP